MSANGFENWIYEICVRDKQLTLVHTSVQRIFGANGRDEVANLREYCRIKGLVLKVDAGKKIFTMTVAKGQ